ncbi:LacI family DNA-binding transcriptional regulator [Microbacterium testaceum]|uniref:LacI family DNA-binding transcriptional regulator n=1 Tax=Microbacterium testaceum TaxID=2033 RepID=UPI00344AF4CA
MPAALPPRRRAGARARIVDVARTAGVSAQTVSNVLNDRPGFTPETRDRVLAAVRSTGYVPDPAGRHLRTGLSRRVGFSMSRDDLDPRNPFTLAFLDAVLSTASARDQRVLVYTHEVGADDGFRADALRGETDGFILANSTPGDPRVAILDDLGIPYALMGRTLPSQAQAWVDIDNAAAIAPAVEHLIDTGRSRIAYVGPDSRASWIGERHRGVVDTLRRHGLPLPEEWNVTGPPGDVRARLEALLAADQARPDAIVAASDPLARVAVDVAREHGLAVGTELAVTGFDGGVLATSTTPHLTTVEIPVPEIADRVVRRLLARIDGTDEAASGEIVDTRLVIAEST